MINKFEHGKIYILRDMDRYLDGRGDRSFMSKEYVKRLEMDKPFIVDGDKFRETCGDLVIVSNGFSAATKERGDFSFFDEIELNEVEKFEEGKEYILFDVDGYVKKSWDNQEMKAHLELDTPFSAAQKPFFLSPKGRLFYFPYWGKLTAKLVVGRGELKHFRQIVTIPHESARTEASRAQNGIDAIKKFELGYKRLEKKGKIQKQEELARTAILLAIELWIESHRKSGL